MASKKRNDSQGARAKIKEAQDDARIPWWPWKQKEASSFVSRGHTLVCRGIIRLWLDIISIETSIEASREKKTALLRPLMARWFSESGRRVLDAPLTRQFRCPTICQIASRLEGELSLSFSPPVAFICIGIYRKKGEEKGQIERTPPFPGCHFCAACNSETRRFYLTRFPRWIFAVCMYSLVRVAPPSASVSGIMTEFRGFPWRDEATDPRLMWRWIQRIKRLQFYIHRVG